jgi:hypothetical protein
MRVEEWQLGSYQLGWLFLIDMELIKDGSVRDETG